MDLVAKEAICCWNGAAPNPSVPPHCAPHNTPPQNMIYKKKQESWKNTLAQKSSDPVVLLTKFVENLTKWFLSHSTNIIDHQTKFVYQNQLFRIPKLNLFLPSYFDFTKFCFASPTPQKNYSNKNNMTKLLDPRHFLDQPDQKLFCFSNQFFYPPHQNVYHFTTDQWKRSGVRIWKWEWMTDWQ